MKRPDFTEIYKWIAAYEKAVSDGRYMPTRDVDIENLQSLLTYAHHLEEENKRLRDQAEGDREELKYRGIAP